MALSSNDGLPFLRQPGGPNDAEMAEMEKLVLAAATDPNSKRASPSAPAASRTLKLHMSGDDVRAWQEYLRQNGFDIKADGDFGARTLAATRQMQKRLGLKVDGKVGDLTRGAVDKVNAMPTPRTRPTLAEGSGPPDNVGVQLPPGAQQPQIDQTPFDTWDRINKSEFGAPMDPRAWSDQFNVDQAAKAKAMAIRGGIDPSTSHSEALMAPDPAAGMAPGSRFDSGATPVADPRMELLQRALMGKIHEVAPQGVPPALIRALMGR